MNDRKTARDVGILSLILRSKCWSIHRECQGLNCSWKSKRSYVICRKFKCAVSEVCRNLSFVQKATFTLCGSSHPYFEFIETLELQSFFLCYARANRNFNSVTVSTGRVGLSV